MKLKNHKRMVSASTEEKIRKHEDEYLVREVVEWDVSLLVNLLVMKNVMPMRECSSLHILTRKTHMRS